MLGGVGWWAGLGMKQLTLAAVGLNCTARRRRAGFWPKWTGWAVVGAVRADRALLSEAGQWPPAGRGRADATHLFLAAMVQPVGPGGRRGTVRFVGDAALCRRRPWPRAGSRGDDSMPLPSPARGARSGP